MHLHWVVRGLLIVAALLSSANALAQERSALLPHTSEGYGYESVVPEGWTDVGQGIFARQRDAKDPTLLAQQSAPVSANEVLASLLPQLGLTAAPKSVGTHQGDALEWTLYQVDVALGEGEVAVDLALSDEDSTTYIVLLQSAPDERDALRESIFLPTLNAFAPLVETVKDVPYRVEDGDVRQRRRDPGGNADTSANAWTTPGRGAGVRERTAGSRRDVGRRDRHQAIPLARGRAHPGGCGGAAL